MIHCAANCAVDTLSHKDEADDSRRNACAVATLTNEDDAGDSLSGTCAEGPLTYEDKADDLSEGRAVGHHTAVDHSS